MRLLFAISLFVLLISPPAKAQFGGRLTYTYSETRESFPSMQSSGKCKLKNYATISLQRNLVFLNGRDGDKLLQSWGNLPSRIDGLIMPLDRSWCITFEYDDVGYIKDDDKEDLDAFQLLKSLREAQDASNKERTRRGLSKLIISRWSVQPRYNQATNNLEWGMIYKDDDGEESVNHGVRLLGRKGVVNATLICDPQQFQSVRRQLASVLKGFQFTEGNKYAQYKKGDKIAEYGLTGLILGGGVFSIWKFWKPICAGFVVVGTFCKKFFGKLTGRSY